jgi:hypothetical protein
MSLTKLPNELLREICKNLVIGLLDTPRVVPKVHYDYEDFDDIEDEEEDDDQYYSRKSLVSLARTNRRLNDIATPFLYHTIRVYHHADLYSLVACLFKAPRLGELVFELCVKADLTLPEIFYDISDLEGYDKLIKAVDNDDSGRTTYQRILKSFPDLDGVLRTSCGKCTCQGRDSGKHDYDCPDRAGEAACALLLLLTPRLHTLHLAKLSSFTPAGYPHLLSIFDSNVATRVLPQLERLILDSKPTTRDAVRLPHGCLRQFMEGRKIKHVELQAPDLLDAESSWEMWEHVETLHMKDAYVSGTWWYLLSKEARPPLKEIEISVSPFENEEQEVEDLESPGLNEALGFYTGTLQKLRVHLGDRMTIQEPYLGPQKRLACLSSMKVLTHLDISARLLFSCMDDMSNCNICNRLPSSLQRLRLDQTDDICLDDNPWLYWNQEGHDLVQATPSWDGPCYDTLFERALRQLAFESAEKLPCLERVLVVRRIVGWERFGPPELGLTVTWTEERKTETAQDLRTMSFSPQRKS